MNMRPKHLLTILVLAVLVLGIRARVSAIGESGKTHSNSSRPAPTAVVKKSAALPQVSQTELGAIKAVLAYLRDHQFTFEPPLEFLLARQFVTEVPAVELPAAALEKLREEKVSEDVLKQLAEVVEPKDDAANSPEDDFQAALQKFLPGEANRSLRNLARSLADKRSVWQDQAGNYHCVLAPEISAALYADLVKADQEALAAARLGLAAKAFGVLLALVLAVGGYFYLDEATKGYYTVLLRLGALTVVGAVGVIVWLALH
jgi:hypothetical protein